jgi:hypothetical protein
MIWVLPMILATRRLVDGGDRQVHVFRHAPAIGLGAGDVVDHSAPCPRPRAPRKDLSAASAADPHSAHIVRPYVEADLPDTDLAVPNVTTVSAQRAFWDKVVILHGLRSGFEATGRLRQEG